MKSIFSLDNNIDLFSNIELSIALCKENSNIPSLFNIFFNGRIFLSCSKSINEFSLSIFFIYEPSSDFSFKIYK